LTAARPFYLRAEVQVGNSTGRAKSILFCGAKGGCGKTSSALASGGDLVTRGYRVGLLDFDPQASLTLGLGYDALEEPWDADPVVVRDDTTGHAVLLFRGGPGLGRGRSAEVHHLIERAAAVCDIVVIDASPDVVNSSTTAAALEQADYAVVPMEATPLDLTAISGIADLARKMGSPPPIRVVFNRHAAKRRLAGSMAERVERLYPGGLSSVAIPTDVAAAESVSFGVPVGWYRPKSRSAIAYTELNEEILKELGLPCQKEC
jgi:chromosome partitioning protein